MKTLLWVSLLFAVPAYSANTTISFPVTSPNGSPATGTVIFRITGACTTGSPYVGMRDLRVQLVSGTLTVSLVPNDLCTPTGNYVVTWAMDGSRQYTETWFVPTRNTTITSWSDLIVSTAPVSPQTPVNVSQINFGSRPNGGYCVKILNGNASLDNLSCPGSGGGTSGLDPNAAWSQIKAGTAGTGGVTAGLTWAQIKAL